jgi:hypothetical protein
MTLTAITNYHWPICWMTCFILCLRLSFPYWFWRQIVPNFEYLISIKGARRVWPVRRGCLLFHGIWLYTFWTLPIDISYLRFVGGLCCLTLNFLYVGFIVITFNTALTSPTYFTWLCTCHNPTDSRGISSSPDLQLLHPRINISSSLLYICNSLYVCIFMVLTQFWGIISKLFFF